MGPRPVVRVVILFVFFQAISGIFGVQPEGCRTPSGFAQPAEVTTMTVRDQMGYLHIQEAPLHLRTHSMHLLGSCMTDRQLMLSKSLVHLSGVLRKNLCPASASSRMLDSQYT